MRLSVIVLSLALVLLSAEIVSAQDQPASAEPQQLLDAAQLDQLVAPIALYPDPLLAQTLMASTYPLEVVQADRWAKANKGLKGDKLTAALDKQDWDASVKELVSTPTVLAMMNDKLDWAQQLGDAVLAQQADVMDAIQRLRATAQANGKLETSKQQKVTVKQEEGTSSPIIEIEPASPDVVYVPYYNPSVVYGEWPYPDYPPYYYPPPAGYIVGGAIATGLAWGAAYAIGREIWDDIDWRHGNIDIDIDRNVDIDVDRNFNKWEHNSYHRRGVAYNNADVKNKFNKANINAGDRKLDYRGRSGEQVLKPNNKPGGGGLKPDGGFKPGGDKRPDLGGKGERPGGKPDIGSDADAIVKVALKLDAAAVLPRVEIMRGRVLVDAHDLLATLLHPVERGVGMHVMHAPSATAHVLHHRFVHRNHPAPHKIRNLGCVLLQRRNDR